MNRKALLAQPRTTATIGLALVLMTALGSAACSAPAAEPPSNGSASSSSSQDAISDLDTVQASAKTNQALGIKTWGVNPTQDGSPGAVIHAYDDKNTLLAEIVHTTTEVDASSHRIDIGITTNDGSAAMSIVIKDAADGQDPTVPSDAKVLNDDLSSNADAMKILTAMDSDVGAHNPEIRDDGSFASEVSLGSTDSTDSTDTSDLSDKSLRFDYWGQGIVNGAVDGATSLVNKGKEIVHKVDCDIVEPIKCGKGVWGVAKDSIQLVKSCGGSAAKDVGEEEAAGAACAAVTGVETAGTGAAACEVGTQVVAAGTFIWQCGKAAYQTYKDASGTKDNCENADGQGKCSN